MLSLPLVALSLVAPRYYQRRTGGAFCCEVAPTEPASSALKYEFRLRAARANRGFSASATEMASISLLAEELESCNVETAPTESALLPGEWRLDFTDAADVLSLGLQPFSEVGDVWQNVEPGVEPRTFVAQNVVELLPRGSAVLSSLGLGASSRYSVEARCNVLSETRVRFGRTLGWCCPMPRRSARPQAPTLPSSPAPSPPVQLSLAFVGASLQPLASAMGQPTALPSLSGTLPPQLIKQVPAVAAADP